MEVILDSNRLIMTSVFTNLWVLIILVLMMFLPSDRNIAEDAVSEFIRSNLAPLFILFLIFQILTVLCQAVVIYRHIDQTLGSWLFLGTTSLFSIIIFPIDPGGEIQTITGFLHELSVLVGSIVFLVVLVRLYRVHKFERLKPGIYSLLAGFFIFSISVVIDYVGITERIFLIAVIFCHYLLALELFSHTRDVTSA